MPCRQIVYVEKGMLQRLPSGQPVSGINSQQRCQEFQERGVVRANALAQGRVLWADLLNEPILGTIIELEFVGEVFGDEATINEHLFLKWTKDANDTRSFVTLRSLLSFTSGFNDEGSCISSDSIDYLECVEIMYNTVEHVCQPGVEICYDYNSVHLQIAGGMAMMATNKTFAQLSQEMFDSVGMSDTFWNNPEHPSLAGGIRSTVVDYEKFLIAYTDGHLLSPAAIDSMETDYTPEETTEWGFRAVPGSHYGLAHWIECEYHLLWQEDCAFTSVHSSPGWWGFYPIVNRDLSYTWIIGMRGRTGLSGCVASWGFKYIVGPLIQAMFE